MTSNSAEGVGIIGGAAGIQTGRIGFVDSSLCAAHQALWSGAIAVDLLFPSLDLLDAAGLRAVDVLDPEISSLLARRGENPLRLARIAARRLTRTPANVWVNARCLLGNRPLDASLIERGIAQLADCGVHRVTCFDAVNDAGAIGVVVGHCRKSGIAVSASLVYQASPHHDGRYYFERARLLAGCAPDSIVIADLAGSLTPERTSLLVAEVGKGSGPTPIEFRTHCRSGVAEMSCFAALSAGASVLHTASNTLSGGWSLPSTSYFAEHLSRQQAIIDIDAGRLSALDEYLTALATYEALPHGEHQLPDTTAERYQIPVALMRQCQEQAAAADLTTDALCQACLAVQKDMGYPTLAHPVGAMVVAQAALYATGGEAYPKVTPEIAAFAIGDFGTPPGPLHAKLGERVRKYSQPKAHAQGDATGSDEQRILAAWFPGAELAPSRSTSPEPVRAATPQQYLKERIERLPALQSIRVQKGAFHFELDRARGATK